MKEHPILFSTQIVQANMDDAKTMTRRTKGLETVNESPDDYVLIRLEINPTIVIHKLGKPDKFKKLTGLFAIFEHKNHELSRYIKCSYGQPGDLLWVRESFAPIDHPELKYRYKADHLNPKSVSWKPSIHMPKSAARIWLQVEEIRMERLNDISEEDAMAEGVSWIRRTSGICFMDYRIGEHIFPFTAKKSFQTLFLSINGKPKPQREFGEKGKIVSYTALAWDQEDFDINWAKYNGKYRQRRLYVTTNPWVWVVKYKVLSTTGKPQICYKTNEVCKYDCKGLCRESM